MRKAGKMIKKRITIGNVINICYLLICYFFIVPFLTDYGIEKTNAFSHLILIFCLFSMYWLFIFQNTIHELGYLLFGLLTGYRLRYLRIGRFQWLNNKITCKKTYKLFLTRQCIMTVPEDKNERVPFLLHILGGVIMDIIFAFVFLGLYLIFNDIRFISNLLLLASLIGFSSAFYNSIPAINGKEANDGDNIISLLKSREARQAYRISLKAYDLLLKGIRFKDMPSEWFTVPSEKQMKNSMFAVIAEMIRKRLMDDHSFEEVVILTDKIIATDIIIEKHQYEFMVCDKIYCELIGENRCELLEKMLDKKQKPFMRAYKKQLSVIRTEYAYALFAENDEDKAASLKEKFEKSSYDCPLVNLIESERELMEIAAERYSTKKQCMLNN